jgi:hypothetical protein
MENFDMKKTMNERIKLIYDYMCWNFRMSDTKTFMTSYLEFEDLLYESEVFKEKRILKKIKIILSNEKPESQFHELMPNFSIYKDAERLFVGNEEIFTAIDIVKRNLKVENADNRRESIRRKKKRKRIKFREKLKKRKRCSEKRNIKNQVQIQKKLIL